MRSRKTLPEELFGRAWARRLRIGIPASALVLFAVGSVVFVVWSQTVGRFIVAASLGLGVMWFLLRAGDPTPALHSLCRARPYLLVLGGVLVAGGWAAFALIDQDLGLLLVLLGAAALMVNLLSVKQEPLSSPMDGPAFGDTPPYGE